ncbi:FAD-dependent oxidoreductase, partial [Williamsia sp.]|uniref:FAD-dependent oxidoreductase n=1 Tax=Williamsia sp. TaxID=1872085 RepID=UPI001A32C24D
MSSSQRYDVIVVGLGGMGSAAAYHLAARGQCVLGLERFSPAHDRGSSHGGSRIIRQSYFEDPAYVPLLLRAYELWEELARDSGRDVYRITGGLFVGPPTCATVSGSRHAAELWGLAHEVLTADEVR